MSLVKFLIPTAIIVLTLGGLSLGLNNNRNENHSHISLCEISKVEGKEVIVDAYVLSKTPKPIFFKNLTEVVITDSSNCKVKLQVKENENKRLGIGKVKLKLVGGEYPKLAEILN